MKTTLAFDIYGTLIDTNGVMHALTEMIGAQRAKPFTALWRDKQLEYSFRRGLMHRYTTFANCTLEALNFCCAALDTPLSDQQKQGLIETYRCLPAFSDVASALHDLRTGPYQIIAFSNGQTEAVNGLLQHAQIDQYFDDTVSVDEIRRFKPDPKVYRHLLTRCDSKAENTWLISGNPFDVMGALSTGLKAAWLQRNEQTVFDPWPEFKPDIIIPSLANLSIGIESSSSEPTISPA